jgi:hypothetical protein
MLGYLSIIKWAASVALFFLYSQSSFALNYSSIADAYAACQAAIVSGQVCLPVVNVEGCPATTGQYTNYQSFLRTAGTTTCSGAGFYNYSNGCVSGEQFNIETGVCQPEDPVPVCSAGQYKKFGAPEPNDCAFPECPSGYYINLTVAAGYYDCTTNPPDCPLPVPMCSSPSYECMGEASTPTTIPSCDNTCPVGQHANGGQCVPDEDSPVQCPQGYQYNVALASCESAPPIVCQEGFKAGKINGESVCVASSSGTPTQTPTKNTGTISSTSNNTTTTINYGPDGQVIGSSVSTGTSTSTGTIEMDTTGLAQDSTVKAVLDTLTGTSDRSGDAYQGGGSGSAPSSDGTALAAKKSELQAMISGIQTEFSALKPSLSGGGSIICDGGVDLSLVNAHFEICLEPYTEQLTMIGYGVYLAAAVLAVMIILG